MIGWSSGLDLEITGGSMSRGRGGGGWGALGRAAAGGALVWGKSPSGNWLMPIRPPATTPNTTVAAMSIQARTGFLTQASVRFMGLLLHRGHARSGRLA